MTPVLGTYLYGVIEGTGAPALGLPGMDGASPVRLVAEDGLGAIVSQYTGPAFQALSKEKLVRCLFDHQRVLEHVMQHGAVLPVKIGTLLESPGEVQGLLAQGHRQLHTALAFVRDKIELEVAATWEINRVLQEVAAEEEVTRAKETIAQKGQDTIGARLQLGQLVKGRLDRRRDGYRDRMMGLLKPLAVDAAANALISDAMVMNTAFLVQRDQQGDFDAGVRQLDQLFQGELAFRVIGPLPPYSFSTVEVERLSPEQLHQARQTLRLDDALSTSEVRRAYRRLAAQTQRDLTPGDPLAADQFRQLRRALRVLLACSETLDPLQGDERLLSTRSLKDDDLWVITVHGPQREDPELLTATTGRGGSTS